MRKVHVYIAVITLGIFIVSCTKEGKQGEPGINGVDGNANVKTIMVWDVSWSYSSPSYQTIIPHNDITQDLVDRGVVLVYARLNSGAYNQLPTTFYQSSSYSTSIEVASIAGSVTLFWTDSDLSQPSYPAINDFKIVLIPSTAKLAKPDLDYSNYEEVKASFGLKD